MTQVQTCRREAHRKEGEEDYLLGRLQDVHKCCRPWLRETLDEESCCDETLEAD